MQKVTLEMFEDWKFHPVTLKLMKRLKEERETMKEGLVNSIYDNEDSVRGMCKTISLLLELEYEELFDNDK